MLIHRIVLVGFMCAGKSTVAASLARRLEWGLLDFDVEIERRWGRSIERIVDEEGEEALRAMEAELTREAAGATALVMAPGGGWITQPGLLSTLGGSTLSVWLYVSPEETARRLRMDGGHRPLRDHPDPVGAIRAILDERDALYRMADVRVPGDGRSAEEVAFEVEQIARTRGLAPAHGVPAATRVAGP